MVAEQVIPVGKGGLLRWGRETASADAGLDHTTGSRCPGRRLRVRHPRGLPDSLASSRPTRTISPGESGLTTQLSDGRGHRRLKPEKPRRSSPVRRRAGLCENSISRKYASTESIGYDIKKAEIRGFPIVWRRARGLGSSSSPRVRTNCCEDKNPERNGGS
jgi:hypothetical protein